MKDNRDPVGRKLDIQFDPVSGIYCSLKGGKGVFGNLTVVIMQPPVGKNVPRKGELSARRILGCIRNTYSAARQIRICKISWQVSFLFNQIWGSFHASISFYACTV